jgi:hypothetical protein
VDIADFGPGEPDFATPDHIKQAAIQAIHDNKTKPLDGRSHAAARSDLRVAQAELRQLQPKECVVSVGGSADLQCCQRAGASQRRSTNSRAVLGKFSGHREVPGATPLYVQTSGRRVRSEAEAIEKPLRRERVAFEFAEQSSGGCSAG